MVGELEKRGEGALAGWVTRFVVLDNQVFRYYKSEKDHKAGADPIKGRALQLTKFAVVPDPRDGKAFRLVPAVNPPKPGQPAPEGTVSTADGRGLRQFQLRAASVEERDAWVGVFEAAGALSAGELAGALAGDSEPEGGSGGAAAAGGAGEGEGEGAPSGEKQEAGEAGGEAAAAAGKEGEKEDASSGKEKETESEGATAAEDGAKGKGAKAEGEGEGEDGEAAAATDAAPASGSGSSITASSKVTGFLLKQPEAGVFSGSAKRRFFVLEAGSLCYYKSRESMEAGETPIKNQKVGMSDHVVHVGKAAAGAKGNEKEELAIVLKPKPGTSAKRTWVLTADSEVDRDTWVSAMRQQGAELEDGEEKEKENGAAAGGASADGK